MYTPFENLSDDARVWIFQSAEPIAPATQSKVKSSLKEFLESWKAHGKPLKASFTLEQEHFIIVALDEASYQATGCSIDKLVHLIQSLEKQLNLSLLDRSKIAIRTENDGIAILPMFHFRDALENGELDEHTPVFNNLVETKADLKENWESTVGQSWHKNWLPIA